MSFSAAFDLGKPRVSKMMRRLCVVVEYDLRVGRIAGVIVAEPAAEAHDPRRQRLFAQEPAGDIHLVDALVAHVAAAGVVVPMPIVVQFWPIKIDLSRRAAPEFVIDLFWNHQRFVELTDPHPRLVAGADDVQNLPELAAMNVFNRFAQRLVRPRLRTTLDDSIVVIGSVRKLPAFPHAVADRLLAVHVFAGLGGQDADKRMGVIRRGDRNRVDIFAIE